MSDTPKLKRVTRLDSMPLAEWTPEGFLVDKPIVTSVGIFEYHNDDGSVRKELRLPKHVFDPESLASYKGMPVVITHNAGIVTSANTARETIGTILSEGIPDGNSVRAEIVIHNTNRMKRENLKELSLGYNLVLDETPGTWNGQHYDAIQTEIRINHLALVDKARAGEEARLNIDGKDAAGAANQLLGGKKTMAAKTATKKQAWNADEMKQSIAAYNKRRQARLDGEDEPSAIPEKIIIEGVVKKPDATADDDTNPVASGEGGEGAPKEMTFAEKIEQVKDRRDKRDGFGDPEDVDGAKGIIAQQDEDISCLLELIEKLEAAKDLATTPPATDKSDDDGDGDDDDKPAAGEVAKPMNTDSVDKLIAERLKLARIGDRLNLDGIEQMKPLDAKKKIIAAIKPDLRLDGKGAGYVETAFDIAMGEYNSRKTVEQQKKQMFNADSKNGGQRTTVGAGEARQRMIERALNGGEE